MDFSYTKLVYKESEWFLTIANKSDKFYRQRVDFSNSKWVLATANGFYQQRMDFSDSEWVLAIANGSSVSDSELVLGTANGF